MKILNYGSLNIDEVFSVDHIVRPGETIHSTGTELFAGGKGANQSVAMARAGLDVWQAGKIGEDGRCLLKILRDSGVGTENISEYNGPTGHAYIQLASDGNNSIILEGGGNQCITRAEVDHTLGFFSSGDYLVLQNEINDVPYIMERGRQKGMKICLNPAPIENEVEQWPLHLVDILILNEIEARSLCGIDGTYEEVLGRLMKKYPAVEIVMTVGLDGSYCGCGQLEFFLHTPCCQDYGQAVDTTAAGDTYLGYYLVSRISGFLVKESMERAAAAAAITVSRKGAMETIPHREEVF